MGGKVGKAVLDLLPEHEDTMGSIARFLTLNQLALTLGDDAARMVWNYANGIDQEEVKDTKDALTKSITAFKSFTVRRREDVSKWISLLSIDLLKRVGVDSSRNNRFPTTCTVQYYLRGKNGKHELTTYLLHKKMANDYLSLYNILSRKKKLEWQEFSCNFSERNRIF